MISYYIFRSGFYKINSDYKSFTHINDNEDAYSISLVTNEMAFDKLNAAVIDNVGNEWAAISEQDFDSAKQKVLNNLN